MTKEEFTDWLLSRMRPEVRGANQPSPDDRQYAMRFFSSLREDATFADVQEAESVARKRIPEMRATRPWWTDAQVEEFHGIVSYEVAKAINNLQDAVNYGAEFWRRAIDAMRDLNQGCGEARLLAELLYDNDWKKARDVASKILPGGADAS